MLSGLRNFALTFLIAALIFGVLAYVIVGFVIDAMEETIPVGDKIDNPLTTKDPNDTSKSPVTTDPPDTTVPVGDENIAGDTFNILLIGTDYQPGTFDDYDYEQNWTGPGFPDRRNRPWGADMLVILRIDKENRKFVFCSIPRNTRVYVDGSYVQLGDTIRTKDINYLCGKVSSLTGLNVDYYATVSVESVSEAIDAVGSVNYYVPEDMIYSDPSQGLEINLKKGTHSIDGEKAAQLLRYVGYKNGNVGRMNTTIEFAKAILAKFTNITYLAKAGDLYEAVSEHVETNFTLDDLLNNLDLIFSYSKFESLTVTYPGSNRVYDGVTYFVPSQASALKMFESYK